MNDTCLHTARQGNKQGVYPSKHHTSTSTEVHADCYPNMVQLIDLICEDMAFHKDDISQPKLVLPGSAGGDQQGYHHQTPRHEN